MIEKIKSIIKKSGYLNCDVNLSDSLSLDLRLDSLDMVEIGMHIEEEYNIKITTEQLDKLVTVQDIVNLVVRLNPRKDTL